jgi:rusticyanin
MKRCTTRTLIGPVAVAAIAAALATVLVACGGGTAAGQHASAQNPQYNYYRSMMGRYHGGMMGGGPGNWMMGAPGYRWMTGTGGVPGWMHGGRLPGYMMGTSTDPGKVMGRFWANAPGPRVTPAQAARLGGQAPANARINRAANTITFTAASASFAVVASPPGGPDETFRIAGLVNPTVIVPAGARVSIEVINADPDTAHGLVITASTDASSWMPMMTARPAFRGSAVWFLGNPTRAGMHARTLTFTATKPGHYRYLCAVPGHASKGMIGTFIVSSTT